MGSFSWIFIRNINIFFSYYFCSIFETNTEVDIFECDGNNSATDIEHSTHDIESFFITSTYIYESSKKYIAYFIGTDNSFFVFKTVFEQFSNHICIFCECSDRSSHISRRKNPVFITYRTCCSSIICNRYDG